MKQVWALIGLIFLFSFHTYAGPLADFLATHQYAETESLRHFLREHEVSFEELFQLDDDGRTLCESLVERGRIDWVAVIEGARLRLAIQRLEILTVITTIARMENIGITQWVLNAVDHHDETPLEVAFDVFDLRPGPAALEIIHFLTEHHAMTPSTLSLRQAIQNLRVVAFLD